MLDFMTLFLICLNISWHSFRSPAKWCRSGGLCILIMAESDPVGSSLQLLMPYSANSGCCGKKRLAGAVHTHFRPSCVRPATAWWTG